MFYTKVKHGIVHRDDGNDMISMVDMAMVIYNKHGMI